MATAKHKFQQLVFNPVNQKLTDFLDELQKLAKDAFGVAAQAIIDQFIYAKMPPHLKKSKNQAYLENGTYEQIHTLKENKSLTVWNILMKLRWTLWRTNNNLKATQIMLEISTVTQTTLTPTTTKLTENLELSTLPVRYVAKRTTPQRDVTLEPMQQTGPFPGRTNLKNRIHMTVWLVVSRLQPNILTRNVIFSLRNSDWRTVDQQKKIPPIPFVVWQRPLEKFVENSN